MDSRLPPLRDATASPRADSSRECGAVELFEQSKPRERKPTAVNDACLLPRIRALTDGSRREVMACVATSAAIAATGFARSRVSTASAASDEMNVVIRTSWDPMIVVIPVS